MLAAIGFDPAASSNGLLAWNLGGVAGALLGAGVVSRLGSRATMIAMCIGAIAGALLIRGIAMPTPSVTIFLLFAWTGGLINGVQTLLYALAANVYPATIRATGVGTAVAFGRIGGVVSAYAGLTSGLTALFALLAGLMGIVAVTLAVLHRHIPRMVTGPAPAGAYARARA
jgi:AAHS family 4-hydroxybenzoate transporter-like MFS transporter